MANSITGWSTFSPNTLIKSAEVNDNLEALRDQSPLLQKYTIPYTTFVALGAVASGTVTAFSLAADEALVGVIAKHSALFGGGAISAAKLKVGISGSGDKYLDEFDCHQAVAAAAQLSNRILECEFTTTAVLVTLSLTGGNLSGLSTGSIDIYFQRMQLPA